jgi:hypothetical protein
MTTIRMRATIVYEYDANPEHYPAGSTPEQMAKIDNNMDMAQVAAEQGDMTIVPIAEPTHDR